MTRRPGSRVVRVITRLNIGGPARHALLLSHALNEEFPTRLLSGRPEAREGELKDPRVPVRYVSLVRRPDPVHDARALLQLRRELAVHGDLLHTHTAKAGALARTAALSMRHRPVTVHTFHGHVLSGYFGPRVERTFLEVERALARSTDVLIAISPEVRDELVALGVGRGRRFEVLPLGLDLDAFLRIRRPTGALRSALGVPPSVPLVGMVARLVPIKDHYTLVDAVSQLSGVHLAIIGDGELAAAIRQRTAHLGMTKRVHFSGWWDDVAGAMSDVDVVALSSRNEGTPVSLIEALAAGRPVVATDVGGVRHVVSHGRTGLLVRAGDAQALADSIRSLLENPGLGAALGSCGRTEVTHRFGRDRLVADMRGLYRELLPKGGRPAS